VNSTSQVKFEVLFIDALIKLTVF